MAQVGVMPVRPPVRPFCEDCNGKHYDFKELHGPGFDSRQGQETFLFSKMSRPALGPTQPPIHWVPGSFPGSKEVGALKLTTHLNLVLRLRMSGTIPLLPLYAFMVWTGKNLPSQQSVHTYISFPEICHKTVGYETSHNSIICTQELTYLLTYSMEQSPS